MTRNMKGESNGSGSVLEDETKHEDPPRRDCKLPSRNSFLSIENAKLAPPLLQSPLTLHVISSQGTSTEKSIQTNSLDTVNR
jgi:hypothetical protein